MRRRHAPRTLLLAAGLGAVVALTLLPGDLPWQAMGYAGCLACGEMRTLDAVQNLLLFIPVGVLLTWLLRGAARAVAAAAVLSLTIELLQLLVPGRDASVIDVVMNSAGAAIGAFLVGWRRFSDHPKPVGVWWAVTAALFWGVVAATAVLVRPAALPQGLPLYGQWAPRRDSFDPFRGRVISLDVGGIPAPHLLIPDQMGIRRAWESGAPARLELAAPPAGSRPVLDARVVAVDDEVFMIAEQAGRWLFRPRLVASDLGLRPVMFAALGTTGRPEQVVIEAAVNRREMVVHVASGGAETRSQLPLDVTLGWALILPAEVGLGEWRYAVSAAWVALLVFPAAFVSSPVAGRVRVAVSSGLAACVVGVGLGVVPALLGSPPTHWTGWAGGAAGVAAGWALAFRDARGRAESRT